MAKKFELQNRYDPTRIANINEDDRCSDCGGCIVYFEPEFDRPDFGGYEGCEACGAITQVPPERPEPQPLSADQIFKAMEDTYQSCAHDVEGSWAPEDLLDFIVSTEGSYADLWSNERYFAGLEMGGNASKAAVERFKARYGRTA